MVLSVKRCAIVACNDETVGMDSRLPLRFGEKSVAAQIVFQQPVKTKKLLGLRYIGARQRRIVRKVFFDTCKQCIGHFVLIADVA